jgi:hypothetical protein
MWKVRNIAPVSVLGVDSAYGFNITTERGQQRLIQDFAPLGKTASRKPDVPSTTSKYFAFDLIARTARSVSCFLTTAAPAQHP